MCIESYLNCRRTGHRSVGLSLFCLLHVNVLSLLGDLVVFTLGDEIREFSIFYFNTQKKKRERRKERERRCDVMNFALGRRSVNSAETHVVISLGTTRYGLSLSLWFE